MLMSSKRRRNTGSPGRKPPKRQSNYSPKQITFNQNKLLSITLQQIRSAEGAQSWWQLETEASRVYGLIAFLFGPFCWMTMAWQKTGAKNWAPFHFIQMNAKDLPAPCSLKLEKLEPCVSTAVKGARISRGINVQPGGLQNPLLEHLVMWGRENRT